MIAASARGAGRLVLRCSVYAVPFLAAGRIDWPHGWVLTGVTAAAIAVNLGILSRFNPEVIRLRMQPIRPREPFDKLFVLGGLVLFLCAAVVAGLDSGRYGWSRMGGAWTAAGLALYAAGMVPISWSLAVNRFLSPTVEVRAGQGHTVVKNGPYRIVRHPMYSGLLLVYLSIPLILGSWWALIPMGLVVPLLVYRTAREDATLRAKLPGYSEFTATTRFKLIAGVW